MENTTTLIKEEKDTLENAVRFLDALTKSLEGLKDKYSQMIFEAETKSEKVEGLLKSWTDASSALFKTKFEELYEVTIKENSSVFSAHLMSSWTKKFKDNNEFALNMKILLKSLQNIRNTIKNKVCGSDPLSYTNLTDSLIQKNKSNK